MQRTDLLRGVIDALDQAAGIDPLLARVPALDTRRIEQILPHVAAFQESPQTLLEEAKILGQADRTDDQLSGIFDWRNRPAPSGRNPT